jgi:hypothetical protein
MPQPRPRIDFVGIIEEQNQDWEQAKKNYLQRIVQASGPPGSPGAVRENNDPEVLARQIDQALNLVRFQVLDQAPPKPGALVAGVDALELGEKWEYPDADWRNPELPRRKEHYVQIVGDTSGRAAERVRKVILEGGESVELQLDDHRLLFADFEGNGRSESVVVDGPGGLRLRVKPQMPKPGGQERQLAFRISIQSQDRTRFSPRPRHAWVEIEPDRDGPITRFYAYDFHFEPDKPVPLLQFSVGPWPGTRTNTSRIQLWFSYDENVSGEQEYDLIDLLSSGNVPKFPELSIIEHSRSERGSRFVLDEQHEQGLSDYPLYVRVLPPPDELQRRFFDESRHVRHTFEYWRPVERPRILISRKKDWKGEWLSVEMTCAMPR